jgi:hypothetical protein
LAGSWVRFDEYEDVLASTDLLAMIAPNLRRYPSNWKWMILAAQNGLQGALVCAIQDTSGTSILEERSATKVLRYLETGMGDMPQERMADFMTLFRKYRKMYPCSGTIQQLKQIRRLHQEFRNNFAHFVPKGWSIELAGLPRIIETAVKLIEEVMKQDQVLMRLSGNKKRRLERNLAVTRTALEFLSGFAVQTHRCS